MALIDGLGAKRVRKVSASGSKNYIKVRQVDDPTNKNYVNVVEVSSEQPKNYINVLEVEYTTPKDYLNVNFLGEWTPLELFQSGEQGAWYDPSDLTTLFQDEAGTTPVTDDGDPVGLMLDKSGNGNHATQSVSARRPVYRADGSLHKLEFDGVDDYLSTTLAFAFSYPSRLIAGLDRSDAVSIEPGYFGISNAVTNRNSLYLRFYQDTAGAVLFPVADFRQSTVQNTNNKAVISGVYDSVGTYARVDGVASVDEVTGDIIDAKTLSIGALIRDINSYKDGGFFGGIYVSASLSTSDMERSEAYIATKSGVTL